jgi:hypothetical protein
MRRFAGYTDLELPFDPRTRDLASSDLRNLRARLN